MGKTAFSGPVYGAKTLLWSHSQAVGGNSPVSTAPVLLASMIVPSYQDYFITEINAYRASTASTAFKIELVDKSSRASASTRVVGDAAITSSLADSVGSTIVTADGGEYEGRRVAAGSTLYLRLNSSNSSAAALASSGFSAWVFGFTRYIDSTRAV
jgi:hypothetical protein